MLHTIGDLKTTYFLNSMEAILLLALVSLCCLASSKPQVFFVIPDHSNCTVNGTTLNPCYTFHQLINNAILASLSESSVTLLLLSGSHVIPEGKTLRVSNLSDVVIHPWNEQKDDVVIECQLKSNLLFQDINHLNISSLHFNSCTVQCVKTREILNVSSFYIKNCIFEESKKNYALIIHFSRSEFNFTIKYCKFLSNNGAIVAANLYGITELTIHLNLLIDSTVFQGNWRNGSGGALQIENTVLKVNRSQLIKNTAREGGAISATISLLVLEKTNFYRNSVSEHGSSLFLQSCGVNIIDCNFINNSAESGGAVYAWRTYNPTTYFVSLQNSTFQDNHAKHLGGALIIFYAKIVIINCWFASNSADTGGAIFIQGNEKEYTCIITNSNFIFNEAESDGGALYCIYYGEIQIQDGSATLNSAVNGSGGFAFFENCPLQISFSKYNISSNRAKYYGGAIYGKDFDITVYYVDAVMANNTAKGMGGALYLIDSKISLSSATLTFDHNIVTSATGKGGAIFVQDKKCEEISYPSQCFLLDQGLNRLMFTNNSANEGHILYGGLLDRCFSDYYIHGNTLGIDDIKNISEYVPSPLAITSEPVRVCLCSNNLEYNCATRALTLVKMRGEVIDLEGVVVDQDENPKESFIRAGYTESEAKLGKGEGNSRDTKQM